MLAVGGGLLAAAGLFFVLAEVDGYDQRTTGLAVSLLFVVLGVAISTINRSSRAANAGVVLSLLAVVPLTIYLFANADLFADLSGGEVDGNVFDGIRGVVTLMLGCAAVLWLAGYVLGPGRRFSAYLGAALLALWAIPLFNIQVSALEDTVSPFGQVTFDPVPTDPGFSDPFDDPSFTDPSFDDPSFTDPSFGDPFDDPSFDEPFAFEESDIPDPSTKLGVVSLVFGAAYLAFAGWRDRRGDARMATAALAPALFILLIALGYLTGHVGWVGWGLLTMAVGAAVLAVGLGAQRRAPGSAWPSPPSASVRWWPRG